MQILIDGAYGEGGGQIVRTSMSLAAITQQCIKIINLRAKRTKPGLKPQHLTACQAVAEICNGKLDLNTSSMELSFFPNKIRPGIYNFNIETAGSAVLVAQTLIPILIQQSEPSYLRIIGGTHVLHSPSYDYFEKVFIPAIRQFGVNIHVSMLKPGFYPAGGGILEINISPSKLTGCTYWQTENEESNAIIRLSRLHFNIAEREANILKHHQIHQIQILEEEALSSGNAVTLWKGFKGAYVPGVRGKPAEKVAEEVVIFFEQQMEEIDLHLADQIILYAALAEGLTEYRTSLISEHIRTNKAVIAKFLDRKITLSKNKVIVSP